MKKFIYPLIFLMSAALLTSCKDEIPTQEMSEAHGAISRAYAAEADKYAPELLKKAEDGLYASHNACQSADAAKAKELAAAAKQDAEAAINVSLPKAASANVADAKTKYDEAKEIGAEEFAPSEMSSASENISKAEKLNNDRSYAASSAASADAVKDIETAKAKTLAQAPLLTDRVSVLRNDLNTLREQDASEQFSSETASVDDILNEAERSIKDGNIQKAANEIKDSSDRIDNIRSAMLAARAQTARNDIAAMRNEGGEQYASELLRDADSLLDNGESAISNKNWESAESNIKQAENKIAQAKPLVAKGVSDQKTLAVKQAQETVANKTEADRLEAAQSEEEAALAAERAAVKKAAAAKTAAKRAAANKQSAKGGNVYTVKTGDCLWRISQKVYNNSRLWPRIYMTNRDKIKDPDLIYPGQRLVIPAVFRTAPAKRASSAASQRRSQYSNQATERQSDKRSIIEKDYSDSDRTEDDSDYEAFRKKYESFRSSTPADRSTSYDNENFDDGRASFPRRDGESSRRIFDSNRNTVPDRNDSRLSSDNDSLLPEGIFRENQ